MTDDERDALLLRLATQVMISTASVTALVKLLEREEVIADSGRVLDDLRATTRAVIEAAPDGGIPEALRARILRELSDG